MIEITRVLCPVDFSDVSSHALDHAVALGRWYGASVTALHVIPHMPAVPYVWTAKDLERMRLDVVRFAAQERGGTGIHAEAVQGNVAGEILRRVESMPADLLVMGTHGRSGFERLMLGSVTERVLHKALCAMLTVPPKTADHVPTGPPLFKRILCAVDFSSCSLKALEYASSLAREADAQLTVVHVVEPLPEYVPVGAVEADYDRTMEERARTHLHEVTSHATRSDSDMQEVVAMGKPSQQILKIAHEQHSELIALGVHGRSAAGLMFFGSTANQIARRADCPVLTLKG